MTVDVIILSNCKDEQYYTANNNCLNSLLHSEKDILFNIIVIESNPDFYEIALSYRLPNVTVVIPEQPFNLNRYLNIGLTLTKEPWIVFTNNDVIFHKGWLSEMFKVRELNPSIQSFCPFDHTSPYLSNQEFSNQPYHTGYRVPIEFVGWCFVAERSLFDKTGRFDETFDLYFQDNDFASTLEKHSIVHAMVPASNVERIGGYTTKTKDASQTVKYALDKEKFSRKWQKPFWGSHRRLITWLVFLVFFFLSAYAISRHELWGDEVHCWNISKGSSSYSDLIHNRRYEGHPPAWFTILWTISKFTHNVAYMQAAQWTLAVAATALLCFFSPLPLIARILIPFGYYFLWEYDVFSRNYVLGILFAFCICLIIRKEFRGKLILYYLLLFCLSNVHLLATLLAASLHFYFLLFQLEKKKSRSFLLTHLLLGGLVLLPALLFISPPSDGQTNLHFWLDRWTVQQLKDLAQAPVRAFLPMPAWWKYSFWNTEFLLQATDEHPRFRFIRPIAALSLIALVFLFFRKEKKSMALFACNLLLSLILAAVIISLTSMRYAGYIYISFIVAAWLYCYERPITGNNRKILYLLLGVQVIAGVFAVTRDIRYPFSNLYRMKELVREVPAGKRWVTDYWTMNGVVAFMDQPAYCVDMQKELSFVLWGPDIVFIQKNPHRYSDGFRNLFQKTGLKTVYMVTMSPPGMLAGADDQLAGAYHITLIDQREGAIEKGSNLYLYQFNPL